MPHSTLALPTLTLACIVAIGATGCTSDTIAAPLSASTNQSDGRGAFQRYVAIGTSVSAGVQSDGLVTASQALSWPVQLAAMAGRTLAVPFIDGTGCRSPLAAPLASGIRASGEGAGTDPSQLSCSALRADVTLPVDNVALNGALAKDALFTTSQSITDAGNAKIYGRVLEPGQTQVSTMMARNPKLVSVELGANEVLESHTGVAIPGVTIFPFASWAPLYDAVLDSVQKVSKTAVVVGLIDDINHIPAFRTGDELWTDRAEFGAFNVSVSDDCHGSANLIFVPVRVPVAVGTGVALAQHGAGPVTFSCAAGAPTDQDFVLTPGEAAIVNSQMHAMTAHIQSEAARRGFAFFALGTLYDRSDLKPPFSVVSLMTGGAPYGEYFSLDGLHPSGAGQTVLARAAADALNATYGFGIPLP
jgi:hypothetical protein